MQSIRNPILMALASTLALSGVSREAVAEEVQDPELIPLVLTIDPQDPEPYPIPTCSKCRKLALTRQSAATGTQAELGLVLEGEPEGFEGHIDVTVVLDDGTVDALTIEDVSLEDGEEIRWVLEGPRWDQAEMAWLTFVPAAP